jgi:hypothetical protein
MGRFAAGGIVTVLVLTAPVAGAQSLGDIARQEEARRKSVQSAGKVYTNDSLRPEPPPSAAPASSAPVSPAPDSSQPAPSAAPTPPSGAAPSTPGGTAGPDAPPAPVKDEAYWRKRMADERSALTRAEIFQEALQSRINALSNDFESRDDPAQRATIGADRQKALAELDRVRQEIQQHRKAIIDIQEEARRANAPAGWVR